MEITKLRQSTDTTEGRGESLDVDLNFDRIADDPADPNRKFGGLFMSLLGLTDTLVSLDGSGQQPDQTTSFPGYYADFDDFFRGFGTLRDRTIDQITFDIRRHPDSPAFVLKIELKDERGTDRFSSLSELNDTNWRRITLSRSDFSHTVQPPEEQQPFLWTEVSQLTFLVERIRRNPATGENEGSNPDQTRFLLDNVALVDSDGQYPDWDRAATADGQLAHFYERAFLDQAVESSSRYFVDWAAPGAATGGIIQDRGTFADLLTTGGVGFQLTSYVVSASRGYFAPDPANNRAQAAARVRRILELLGDDSLQGPDRVGPGRLPGLLLPFPRAGRPPQAELRLPRHAAERSVEHGRTEHHRYGPGGRRSRRPPPATSTAAAAD